MFYDKVFVDHLSLEASWGFIFAVKRRSTKHFPQIRPELVILKFH